MRPLFRALAGAFFKIYYHGPYCPIDPLKMPYRAVKIPL